MPTAHLNTTLREKLQALGQEQLADAWEALSPSQQEALAAEIEGLDPKTFLEMRTLWEKGGRQVEEVTPWREYQHSGCSEDQELGRSLLSQGKMGCLVLAGGQGVRLGAGRPKGTFPVSVIQGKSLFQLLAERVLAARAVFGGDLPLAIMTSPANHAETVRFFEQHNHFGLPSVTFFQQKELPLLNDEGDLFLEEGKLAKGPNGNGEVFRMFCDSGIWDHWQAQGVEFLNVVLIDNPLADPFDAELLGFASRMKSNLVVKAIFAEEATTRVGILGNRHGQMRVVEYSELKGDVPEAALANLSLYCVSMKLAKEVSEKELLLHMVKRKGWKFETFIFDLWQRGEVLVYPKRQCFAPLKAATGEGSLEAVQRGLLEWDRLCLERLSRTVPDGAFELDPHLYYLG